MATPRVTVLSEAQLLAGKYLKDIRHRLGLGLRDVQEASAKIAAEENNQEMYISAARLVQIENESSTPSVFKTLSLCIIYDIDFLDLLAKYGVRPDRIHSYRRILGQKATHPISTAIHERDTTVTIPVRLDPRFRWETTQLLNRMVAVWGQIPAAFLVGFNPRKHICGFVGLEDYTMFPLLRPGALVTVDGDRRRIVHKQWENEQERPIYFIELRDGYRCAWCQLTGTRLTLIPYPTSPVLSQSFNYPDDAEIVGQVVGVAMGLVPIPEPSLER